MCHVVALVGQVGNGSSGIARWNSEDLAVGVLLGEPIVVEIAPTPRLPAGICQPDNPCRPVVGIAERGAVGQNQAGFTSVRVVGRRQGFRGQAGVGRGVGEFLIAVVEAVGMAAGAIRN